MRKRLLLLLFLCFLALPCHGEGAVCLTFDDGPSGRFTRRLLEGLEQREVKATFFLCGYRVEQYPELAQRMVEDGCEIGLHGYSHKSMKCMPRFELEQELEKTGRVLPEGIGLLRPPGGMASDTLCQVAAEEGLPMILWSLDPKDWATHDTGLVERYVLNHVRDGDVILLHDMSDSSVDAALFLTDALTERGFRFLTVSEMAEEKGISLEPGKLYQGFGGKEER